MVEMATPANVRVMRFFTKIKDGPDGQPVLEDWVEIAPRGDEKRTVVPEAVRRVQKWTDGVWDVIKPAYDAWKKGEELPETGTPLAAWSGVKPHQIEFLKGHMIRTVEDIVALTDGMIDRIRMPGLRDLRSLAIAWKESLGNRKVEQSLADKDAQIAALQSQMNDLVALIEGRDQEPTLVKRKPGRPPRASEEAA